MESDVASAAAQSDETLRAEGERLERLLDELRGVAGPETWPRIEELVQRLMALHGVGLARLLAHLEESGAATPALSARLCDDELVSSLLLLHGLHPSPVEERVRRALDRVRPLVGGHAVELVSLSPEGNVQLAAPGVSASFGQVIRIAVEEAAPEVSEVRIEGLVAGPGAGKLVTLGVPGRGS